MTSLGNMSFELYSYYRSSCSWRVRLALHLKQIPFKIIPVNLVKGEQKSAEYLSICPGGKVPTLKVIERDATTKEEKTVYLSQSIAILEYLEERFPAVPMLPSDLIHRQKVREMTAMIASDIQPIQNLSVLKHVQETFQQPNQSGDEVKAHWAAYWIQKGFSEVEKMLEKYSGKYCFGDTITFADLTLIPQVNNANRFHVNMEAFPIISRIVKTAEKLEAAKLAHPSVQPDCPEETV